MFITTITVLLFCSTIRTDSRISHDYCNTTGCSQAASAILNSIDTNVDPCDNFFQFACGNRLKKLEIPKDKQEVGPFITVLDKVSEELHRILEENVGESDSRAIILAKTYYRACINEDHLEKTGLEVILNLIKSLGGWPVLEKNLWNETAFEWSSLMIKFKNAGVGFDSFISSSVSTDFKNSSIRSFQIDQPNFGLAREYLTTGQYVDVYYDLMVNISTQMGADRFTAANELNASLAFEIELAKIALSSEKRRNYTSLYNPIKVKDLQVKYPHTKWMKFINAMLAPNAKIEKEEIVNAVVPQYLSSFDKLVQKTPKRVQANYAFWRLIMNIIEYSPQSIYKYYLNALSKIRGQSERPPRWKQCTDAISESLKYAVSSLYVRKYFDKESKTKAEEMVNYLKEEFTASLKKLDWMDDATKSIALKKANNMAYHVGYPNELLDDKILDKYYKNLKINEDEYLQSTLNVIIHANNFEFGRLHEIVNKSDWLEHGESFQIGAFYMGSENSIELRAAILQENFFNKDRPMYLNFGAIGSIIGHEITHGFDDAGRQLDENGNLNNWWANSTEERFLEKAKCIIDQYSNYTVEEVHKQINGKRTLGENIADNGGIKEAYYAYNSWIENNGAEQELPGLDYTPHKLFWISAAMNWCSKYTNGYLQLVVETDSHAPDHFRILGPFRNSEEFSKDFNCDLNSNMNPKNKCGVW